MKKNIQSQLVEIKEMLENMDIRVSELENPNEVQTIGEYDGDEKSYIFTQDQFQEFLESYTEKVIGMVVEKISDMDLTDEELYQIDVDGNRISVEIQSDELSSLVESNLVGEIDGDEMVSIAHEVLDDNGIDYTIH